MSVLKSKNGEIGGGGGGGRLLNKSGGIAEEEAGTLLSYRPSAADVQRGWRARGSNWTWWGCATCCLLTVLVFLGVAVLVLEVIRGNEVDTLRYQLESLRQEVDSLKHGMMEGDLLGELKAFEDAVYAEEGMRDDDDEDDDEDDDDYDDYDLDQYEKPHERELLHRMPYLSAFANHGPTPDKNNGTSRDTNTTQESVAGRGKREIGNGPSVPIIAESYGRESHSHNQSEGLRLYESLVTTGGKDPKDPSLNWESTENPIKDYHRVSPLWTSKRGSHHKKYVGGPQIGDPHKRERTVSQTTQAPAPIISRVSRVMQTDSSVDTLLHQPPLPPPPPTKRPAPLTLRQLNHGRPEGEVVVRVYQEQRGSVGATVLSPGDALSTAKPRRKKIRRKNLSQLEIAPVKPTRPIAHYNGDTSQYSIEHPHYDGNGRLRHPDGIFSDWSPSDWMQHLAMNRYFTYNNGTVTVRDGGIYMIYAQIYYVDEHDINGYRVYLNTEPILHCTTMTVHSHGDQRRAKANTCHTSGTAYISADDTVSVRDVNGLRYSLFEPAKSFFGLVKLSDAKIK